MKTPIRVGNVKLPFSNAVRCDNLLFISGQASVDLSTGEIVSGTFAEEMHRSVENLHQVIRAAGARPEDIVQVGCYVRRESDLAEYNRLYRELFPEPYPARTTIINCLPSSILFEIDGVARLPDGPSEQAPPGMP